MTDTSPAAFPERRKTDEVTLRDRIAIAAMHAIASSKDQYLFTELAGASYSIADAGARQVKRKRPYIVPVDLDWDTEKDMRMYGGNVIAKLLRKRVPGKSAEEWAMEVFRAMLKPLRFETGSGR